jgi:hypothetical protein
VGKECCSVCDLHLVVPVRLHLERWRDDHTAHPGSLVSDWLEWFLNDYLDQIWDIDAAKAGQP